MHHSVKFKGQPLHLEGPELKVGDAAPDATLRADLLTDVKLSAHRGHVRIFSVVPSLDTPVCALQTQRFNREAAGLPNVRFFTISCDLPTAQKRFCGAEGIDPAKLIVLSDYKDLSFGRAYGTLIPDLRLECRAAFVVGRDDKLRYVEYVAEMTEHPNYERVLAAAREAAR